MTGRAVLALAVAMAALPLAEAYAQAEHAQIMATELALRRAQIRAATRCPYWEEYFRQHPEMRGRAMIEPDVRTLNLPLYPATGTGGPIRVPDCRL